jgi:hypothetical protein
VTRKAIFGREKAASPNTNAGPEGAEGAGPA